MKQRDAEEERMNETEIEKEDEERKNIEKEQEERERLEKKRYEQLKKERELRVEKEKEKQQSEPNNDIYANYNDTDINNVENSICAVEEDEEWKTNFCGIDDDAEKSDKDEDEETGTNFDIRKYVLVEYKEDESKFETIKGNNGTNMDNDLDENENDEDKKLRKRREQKRSSRKKALLRAKAAINAERIGEMTWKPRRCDDV